MKKIILILIFAFQSLAAVLPTDVGYFTELAIQLRPNPHPNPERIKRLFEEIVREIPDYENDGLLEHSVAAFLKDALKTPFSLDRIVDSQKTPLSGLSNARVFFIQAQDGTLQYVVKAFPFHRLPSGGFLAELSGMALVKERALSKVAVVKPLAIGRCTMMTDKGEKKYGLLLQSIAPGKRSDDYVRALFAYPVGDAKRREQLQQAKKMCFAVGEGLAEFHGLDEMQRLTLSRDGFLRASLKFHHDFNPTVCEKLKGKLNIEALKKHVEKRVRAVLKQGRYYRHGDAGVENIFYDASKNRITFIDVARIHDSASKSGNPLSHDIADLFLFRKKLTLLSEKNLTREEVNALLDALCDGYVGGGGPETFYHALRDVCAFFDPAQSRTPEKQILFQKNLAFVRKIINSK